MSNGDVSGDSTEIVQIIQDNQTSSHTWNPHVGEETIELLGNIRLPQETSMIVQSEAVSILSRCVPPDSSAGYETGLVVGYIQSGKTLSFTTVAALACDNNYPMVIVIAGTSLPLTDQSQRRLRNDLQLDVREDRKWRHIHNPRLENNDHVRIAAMLAEWRDQSVPHEERRIILITVMKHHGHLNHLIEVLENSSIGNLPVLIIDDEADQAGLNNLIREGDESTTYQRLRVLKHTLQNHTFLQYTATPQGPLLINLIDVLSPDFAVVLTPGPDYVGGSDFFIEESQYVREILSTEIATRDNPLQQPPESLMQALRIFFLGVAAGYIRDQGRGHRSMMIHPSQRTVGHRQYYAWVEAINSTWAQVLENPSDPDYQDLIREFHEEYDDLRTTVPNLESFELLIQRLLSSIRRTDLHIVNAQRGTTPHIDWTGSYSHILVGGQALDRGFTVEGLTVTYMPRGVGSRRADTIQQRARFFGYKRPYLGFCRVFIEQEAANAFRRYVEHEEDIRHRLSDHALTGRPLSELRRAFLLTRELVPTRDSIIDIDYVRARFNEGWFYPRAPHESRDAISTNIEVIDRLINSISFNPDDGHPDRTDIQRHEIYSGLSLKDTYDQFLTNLRFASLNDAQNLLGVLVIIRRYLEESPEATCTVYKMSCGRTRVRRLNDRGEIPNLFQGAAPVSPPERQGEIYPGDRFIRADVGITIQIHMLNIPDFSEQNPDYPIIPNIAIWIPREIAGDVIIQNQGNLIDFNE